MLNPEESTGVFFDSAVLFGARASFFYACHKYLLRSLYLDLRTLAKSPELLDFDENDEDEENELGELPGPSTSNSGRSNNLGFPTTSGVRITSSGISSIGTGLEKSKNYHAIISRMSFSICFSESCVLFLLFIFQEAGILRPRARIMNWQYSLFVLLSMILLTIPLSQNLLLTYQTAFGRFSRGRSLTLRLLMTLIPYLTYLFFLSLIPLPVGLESSTILSAALIRLVVLGTFIIGLLSGLGAARNAFEYLPLLKTKRPVPSQEELGVAEEALERVRRDLVDRKKDERRLEESSSTQQSSWMSKLTTSVMKTSELTSLQREIDGLIALEYQMERKLDNMKQAYSDARYARTLHGCSLRWFGRIFAVYCVFRTLSAIINILFSYRQSSHDPKTSYPDLIAHFLTYAISLLPSVHFSAEKIAAVSRQISLVLVGVIILSSVRFVLRAVARVLRLTSQNLGASLLLLILAQLMGMYLISTLVQLRTAFPPSPGEDSTSQNVFSTLPSYEMFGNAFDWSYLLSAGATGMYLWFYERIVE